MSRIPSQGRLLSSHSQNSVLYSQASQQDYDFNSTTQQQNFPSYNNLILNKSFYKQKQPTNQQVQGSRQNQNPSNKKQLFLSLDYIRKYFDTHSIQPIVSKSLKAILDSDYLPQNPYNTLYRLMISDVLLLNSILYFDDRSKSSVKKINSSIIGLVKSDNNSNSNRKPIKSTSNPSLTPTQIQHQQQQILTQRIQVADKQFFVGQKLSRYTNPNALYALWTEVASKQRLSNINQLAVKNKLLSCFVSLGGSAMFLLEGVPFSSQANQLVKMNLKVSQPLPQYSYSSQAMLEVGYYITAASDHQPSMTLTNFCQFIIEQSLQQMQGNPEQIYMFLIKLTIQVYDKEAIVQWSTSQLVHEKARIVKQIVKLLLTQKCQIKTYYYIKSTKKLSTTLYQDYFTLTKSYILITPIILPTQPQQMTTTKRSSNQLPSPTLSIYTPTPLSFMIEHFFTVPLYYEALDKAYGLNSIENEQIFREYRKQKFKKVINHVRLHSLVYACKELFFLSLYDTSLSTISYQNITQALNLVINNPLNFLTQTIHQLKVCKITLNPTASSLTSNSQHHLYQTLQSIETIFFQYQKQSDSPYQQIYVAFETLRKILSILLMRQKFRVNVIKLLIDYAILSLRGVVNSFVGIAWSITGTLHEYVQQLDKSLGNQSTKLILQQAITFDQYLSKIKSLPQRALYLPNEIKHYKQQLGTTQNQTRDLIFVKYIEHYNIYENVLGFYWRLIQGKKIHYPLSRMMEVVKAQAIQNEVRIIESQSRRLKDRNQVNQPNQNRISTNRINGTQIHQMSKGVNNQFTFYSFSQHSLNQSSLNQYRKFYQKFSPYLQQAFSSITQSLPSLTSSSNIQNKYILSFKNLPFLNDLSQQSSGIYIFTLFVDLILRKQMKKHQLINVLYNLLTQFMQSVDKDDIGVLGVYSSWRNLGNSSIVYHGDSDQIYAQTSFESISFIKFDYKRKLPFQQFLKFIQHCITTGKQIQVRLIYKQQKVIQSCNITFNVYFYYFGGGGGANSSIKNVNNVNIGQKMDDSMLKPMIDIGNWDERVFHANRDIIQWGVVNNVAGRKEQFRKGSKLNDNNKPVSAENISSISNTREKTSSITLLNSMKKILLEQQVLIQQLILQQEQQDNHNIPPHHLTPTTLRLFSTSYTNLQQSHHHLLTLLYLLTYVKHDRRNRFQFPFIMDQVSLIQYYLMQHCLKNDNFIFLEGLVVEMANLLSAVKGYLKQREDNLGAEWEILWVEKVICRITGLVKMMMVNVTAQVKKYMVMKGGEMGGRGR